LFNNHNFNADVCRQTAHPSSFSVSSPLVKIENAGEINVTAPIQFSISETPKSHISNTVHNSITAPDQSTQTSETLAGKFECFYKTLALFKDHVQSRVSYCPDPDYVEEIGEWKQTLDKNNVESQKILGFFSTEMQSFVDILIHDDVSDQTDDTESLEQIVDLDEAFEDQLEDTQISREINDVPKSNQTVCRSCNKYFVKTEEFHWICSKEECQAMKCQKCDEDQILLQDEDCCESCLKSGDD